MKLLPSTGSGRLRKVLLASALTMDLNRQASLFYRAANVDASVGMTFSDFQGMLRYGRRHACQRLCSHLSVAGCMVASTYMGAW